MTEAEFSQLLSNLSVTAKALNTASDSINDVIKALEAKLRHINLGLEVWCTESFHSKPLLEEDRDGAYQKVGTIDDELGFTNDTGSGDWCLAVRKATYKDSDTGYPEFMSAEVVRPLLQCSRDTRVAALARFSDLVKQMDAEAKEVVGVIERAKKLVVGRDDAPETLDSLPPGVASGNKMLMDTAAQVVRQRRNG